MKPITSRAASFLPHASPANGVIIEWSVAGGRLARLCFLGAAPCSLLACQHESVSVNVTVQRSSPDILSPFSLSLSTDIHQQTRTVTGKSNKGRVCVTRITSFSLCLFPDSVSVCVYLDGPCLPVAVSRAAAHTDWGRGKGRNSA